MAGNPYIPQEAPPIVEQGPRLFDRAGRPITDASSLCSSRTSTELESPEPLEDQDQERRFQLQVDKNASRPYNQYQTQIEEEMIRLWRADPATNSLRRMPQGLYEESARVIVRRRWVEQRIWNTNWDENIGTWLWKHEEDTAPNAYTLAYNANVASQRMSQEDRDASRPFYQFIYQVRKEHERLLYYLNPTPADVSDRAYANVKNTWIRRSIWNPPWDTLPGRSWKHEEPLVADAIGQAQTHSQEPDRTGFDQSQPLSYAPMYVANSQPVEWVNGQALGITAASQQHPSQSGYTYGDDWHSNSQSGPNWQGSQNTVETPDNSQQSRGQKRTRDPGTSRRALPARKRR
jgi:hypothetical protein